MPDLRVLFAHANEEKSGDQLAGIAARSEEERVKAKCALADMTLEQIADNPLIDPAIDDVSRLILDTHDQGKFAAIKIHQRKKSVSSPLESLELARKTCARKHEARARRLVGEILAARGRLNEALPLIQGSVDLAHKLQTRRDIWLGNLVLAKTFIRLGKDKDAETSFSYAAETIESILTTLKTDSLVRSFVAAPQVIEVFQAVGRHPKIAPI